MNGPNIVEMRTDPKEAAKKRGRQNKQRGKQLENDVSKIFLGSTKGRVAYSGAGHEKADVKIPLPHDAGIMYVECKNRSLKHPTYGPGAKIDYEWFEKLEKERIAMQGRIGAFALRFHNQGGIYFWFRIEDIPILQSVTDTPLVFNGPIIDGRFNKSGKAVLAYTIYRTNLLNLFTFAPNTDTCPNARYATTVGMYAVVNILDFKDFMGYPLE